MGTKRHAILLIGALLLSHQGFAAEFTVDSTVDDVDLTPGDGVYATTTGQCTLRAAIQKTNALIGVDTINLPSGTYELTRRRDSSETTGAQQFTDESGDLDIIDELTIIGRGPEATVIDASPILSTVLQVTPSATVELRGLRIQGGSVRGEGGGGISNAGALTLHDCVITDNQALITDFFWGGGGGLYNTGTLMVNQTTIHHNVADGSGGGIRNNGGVVSMSGGALYSNHVGTVTLMHTFSGTGGGLANDDGTTILSGVTIAWNRAGPGGVIAPIPGLSNAGQLTMDNSTVSDNYVSRDLPGWLDVFEIDNGDQMTLNNVTIGGLGLRNQEFNEGTIQLQNTLIAGTCTGTLQSLGHNLIADATGCTLLGDSTGNLIGVDPRLGLLQDNGGSTETRGPRRTANLRYRCL